MENTPIATGATTAAGTVSGVLTVVQGWVGIGVAVGTFGINWWYKARKDKREREQHENPERGAGLTTQKREPARKLEDDGVHVCLTSLADGRTGTGPTQGAIHATRRISPGKSIAATPIRR